MNKEDIIRIYEKANGWSPEGWDKTVDELERFAALVAAAEREECAKDAARYAFVRTRDRATLFDMGIHFDWYEASPEKLDAAIDAAIRART